MPRNKDLKRLIRARMKKTGEAYTAARGQLLRKRTTVPAPNEYAGIAGMSDAKVEEKTGCNWARWVRALDAHGAAEKSHTEIAALVNKKYKIDGWWSQTVTVGYERIKGLRARGQRRDGTYEVNKTRTVRVPVTSLFDAWADAKTRQRWLKGVDAIVRKATAPKSMRLGWNDGTIVVVGFTPKGESKSVVAVQHTKIADRDAANRLKAFWAEQLDTLDGVLSKGRSVPPPR
jgi:uncharacterized protein YndB with AHSA1/START domain